MKREDGFYIVNHLDETLLSHRVAASCVVRSCIDQPRQDCRPLADLHTSEQQKSSACELIILSVITGMSPAVGNYTLCTRSPAIADRAMLRASIASEMTQIVSDGALNSTETPTLRTARLLHVICPLKRHTAQTNHTICDLPL